MTEKDCHGPSALAMTNVGAPCREALAMTKYHPGEGEDRRRDLFDEQIREVCPQLAADIMQIAVQGSLDKIRLAAAPAGEHFV